MVLTPQASGARNVYEHFSRNALPAALTRTEQFDHFMTQLYCTAATEGRCADMERQSYTPSGSCYWLRGAKNTTRWQPPQSAAVDAMRPTAAGRCLHGERVLLLGDSMTRDTFYQLLAAVGRPAIFPSLRPGRTPAEGLLSAGNDAYGKCLGSASGHAGDGTSWRQAGGCFRDVSFLRWATPSGPRRQMCVRHLTRPPPTRASQTGRPSQPHARTPQTMCIDETIGRSASPLDAPDRVSFLFMTGNDSATMHLLESELLTKQLPREVGGGFEGRPQAERPPFTVLAIQCPVLGRLLPNAYNFSLDRASRHAPVTFETATAALRGVGTACARIIQSVRRRSPSLRVILLGFSGLVGRAAAIGGGSGNGGGRRAAAGMYAASVTSSPLWELERLIFRRLHAALGIRCIAAPPLEAQPAEAATAGHQPIQMYTLESRHGVQVLDRMNVWGQRRPDGMHPTFAAQMATVQLLINSVCHRRAGPGPTSSTSTPPASQPDAQISIRRPIMYDGIT